MNNEAKLIESYFKKALPQNEVSNITILPSDPKSNNTFDATCDLTFGKNRELRICLQFKAGLSIAALKDTILLMEQAEKNATNGCEKILLTPYLSEKKQDLIRESKIGFIDSAGNAWINGNRILIDRRGNKNSSEASSGKLSSIFSDKATLVSRLLMFDDSRGVREISAILEKQGYRLTPGYISKVVHALSVDHYIKRLNEGVKLINKESLLEDWAYYYSRKKTQRKVEGWYYPSSATEELARIIGVELKEAGILTDRSGMHFVDPYSSFDTVDILARNRETVAEVLKGIGASPVDRGANINIIEPLYSISAFYGSQDIEGVQIASDIQLFLDLSHQQKRGVESAEHLYRHKILPRLKG